MISLSTFKSLHLFISSLVLLMFHLSKSDISNGFVCMLLHTKQTDIYMPRGVEIGKPIGNEMKCNAKHNPFKTSPSLFFNLFRSTPQVNKGDHHGWISEPLFALSSWRCKLWTKKPRDVRTDGTSIRYVISRLTDRVGQM